MAAAPTRVVTVYADVVCPFAHVSLRRLADERTRRGRDDVVLVIRSWPLELVNGQPVDPHLIAEEVDALRGRVAADLFAGFVPTSFPASSLPALALTAGAYAAGPRLGEAVALDLRDELFERGRDVGDPAVLRDVAARHGVAIPGDPSAPRRDLDDGRAAGVEGSPHFFLDGASLFCPALDIRRRGDDLDVRVDLTGLGDLLTRCFDGPPTG